MHKAMLAKKLRKYFVMGSQNCSLDPVETLKLAVEAGITAFQFREKGVGSLTGEKKLELGKKLREICLEHNVLFIINDDVDLVKPLEADGIHVGQEDVSVNDLRKLMPEKIIGLSVSNRFELEQSPIHLVDYVGAGPIFSTTTKSDAKAPVGIEWIKAIRNEYPSIPLVGIGGINTTNAGQVMSAGADGVAVISAITKAENIEKAVKNL
ncbi:thiamine phosphate synthase [Ornithinibacillus halotolerans]|uniref:Thiamine-phosphate synthase n=1 Tax=Ornithinibacillus halotolerans TaxID=1274357 RepID=A0A916W7I8_9BACI|nr:thiamine phosphate synthase [Ornithinibacillus halotolerans]GGA72659.1 thiamine-phosphate synthase 1 [Ornithinibacillus halotolerans]